MGEAGGLLDGEARRATSRRDRPAARPAARRRGAADVEHLHHGASADETFDANHPWAPAALLELGNGEAVYGKSAKAAIWFEA